MGMGNYLANTVAASPFVPNRIRAKLLAAFGMKIGADSLIHDGVRFRGPVSIGSRVFVNRGCSFDTDSGSITIEDDVAIGAGTILAAASHNVGSSTRRASGSTDSRILIGRGSWLGAHVTILPGVTVAPGCIIGAGAVVTRDTEPDGVYAGVPARRIRDL